MTAEQASRVVGYPEAAGIASHANHIRFALNLANRAAKGADALSGSDWTGSWNVVAVVARVAWHRPREGVRS